MSSAPSATVMACPVIRRAARKERARAPVLTRCRGRSTIAGRCDGRSRWAPAATPASGSSGPAAARATIVADLVAREPARLGELLGVDGDLLGQGLGEKPHHQARRKRPRLRGQVAHAPAADARLLADLAAHGLLRGLARLDEAGEAGEPGARAPPVAAEQGPLAADREHDHDGIGAREVRRPARRALPFPAGRRHPGRRSALGAEAMAGVPVEQRAGLGEDRRLAGGDRRGEGAHVDQLGVDVGRDVRVRPHRSRSARARRRGRERSAARPRRSARATAPPAASRAPGPSCRA